ncbi:serine protease, S1-C subfamily, contains C-terminal PDZ domain [Microlunatus flavus]|uniref:Serine protease, S1-C subfamily, contains C-terminal PDZ domain n=1 Tax=Microlunatus flavus TaxID=1036181 RepID=A0A1H9JF57_9ACTN|nr:serine protease, S1-C subfamily, contains C-terminal PDZ domain [Microlunatus flavus]
MLAAGGLLTTVLGAAAPASAGVRLVDAYGSSGSGRTTASSTVDSDPASAAESRGVVLVDTVLSDGEAAGTGVVLTSDGEVLTNYHVVEGSTSIRVTLPGSGSRAGRTYTATVVGADRAADVALLQLHGARGLTAARIDDDTLAVGDDVTAVGNAGGTGALTAADGRVSDLSASITTQSEGTVAGERLTKLIETTSDVVPGDSGGPLLDAEGEVVGIDTAASSGQDIDGYAVPIDTALAVVTQIRSGDETSAVRIGPAAFLGVEVAPTFVSDSAYGYGRRGYGDGGGSDAAGATIAGVVDGDAADKAGLAAGDTITQVGSTTVTDAAGLTKALAAMEPGDKVTVTWTTAGGAQQSASVTLDASPVN